MKPVKMGMFSLNHGHARAMLSALMYHKCFELAAVSLAADIDPHRLYAECIDESIPKYSSDEAMLDAHPEIEAVVVASSNDLHLGQMKLCTERGIHIFSMKIPSFSITEYDEMIRLVEKSGIVCQIEMQMRYNASVMRIKEQYESGCIGRLLSLRIVNYSHNPSWWMTWQGTPKLSYGSRVPLRDGDSRMRGGAIFDHPHAFDLARYLTGQEFESIFADVSANRCQDFGEEDMVTAVGKLKNGVVVSIDPSYARQAKRTERIDPGYELDPKRVEVTVIMNGEKGSIMADCFFPNVYHTGLPDNRYTVKFRSGIAYDRIMMLNEFYECIQSGKIPMVNLRSNRRTIELMNACYDSISTGRKVKMS